MNRRNFLTTLAQAAAAFTILPSAVTYERKWRKDGALYTCEIIDPYPPGPHMYPLLLDQRLFVTTFFFGKPIPEPDARTVMSYEEFTKLRSGGRLT